MHIFSAFGLWSYLTVCLHLWYTCLLKPSNYTSIISLRYHCGAEVDSSLSNSKDQVQFYVACHHSDSGFDIERIPQFRHMFLTIFSTILCKIIEHPPNKHNIKVSARLSKYIIVATFHVNKWRHRRDRILSRFARYAAGCCPHNFAYLKEINYLWVKMKQVGYFSSESFCFMLIYKRNT